jgi:hypothetical protein
MGQHMADCTLRNYETGINKLHKNARGLQRIHARDNLKYARLVFTE